VTPYAAGPISGTLLLRGMPISSGKDGAVCLWDAATPNIPIVVLAAGGPVHAMQLHEERGEREGGLVRRGRVACERGVQSL
jgi:hypothetical protein